MSGRKKVEAWVWNSKVPGMTGVLSFDPPLKRFAHRCTHLVESSPADARRQRNERAVVRAAETMMARLPEAEIDRSRADRIFWARFDALGRAVSRLKRGGSK